MRNGPRNQEEFNALMESIDQQLTLRGVTITARPLHAIREVARRLRMQLLITVSEYDADPGDYSGRSLSAHILRWFNERYGDRLRIPRLGSVVIVIRGDPYKIELPIIYGSVKLVCDKTLCEYDHIRVHRRGIPLEPLCVNVLVCIEGLTHGLSAVLTNRELKNILRCFTSSLDSLNQLSVVMKYRFITEAVGDLDSAVSCFFMHPPQYGLSKWSSLQFTEKLLKAFLVQFTRDIPRTHDLAKLLQLCKGHGLQGTSMNLVTPIQCAPAVRYSRAQVPFTDAISAHHASLSICALVARQIKKDTH